MKNKAMETMERHVEKVVFAVGVIFVGWIAYHNFVGSPNAVHLDNGTGPKVAPSRVGSKITDAVDHLWHQIHLARKVSFRHIRRENFVLQLRDTQIQPLPSTLLAMSTARFAPLNSDIEATGLSQISGLVFRSPVVPPLAKPTAVQGRGVALVSTTKTKDVVWVKLKGIFPTKKWLNSMASTVGLKSNEAALPSGYRKTVIYRVEVRRQALEPSGAWGLWKIVPGTYIKALPVVDMAALGPNGRLAAGEAIKTDQQRITDPAFYTLEHITRRIKPKAATPAAPPVNRPFRPPGGVQAPNFGPPMVPFSGGGGGGGAGGGYAPPNMAQIQRMVQRQQRLMREQEQQARAAEQAAANGQPTGMPYNPALLAQQQGYGGMGIAATPGALSPTANRPLRFFDTSVTPGQTYRYEIRVKMLNPVYKVGFHLTDPGVAHEPWLVSDWSAPSNRIHVSANLYFYLISGQINNDQVDFRIFKWVHGIWSVTSEYVSPGQPIGNRQSIPMVDPKTGNLVPTLINFNTGYSLVDAHTGTNGSIGVVVLSPHGQLEVRNSEIDATDPEQQKLITATIQTGTPGSGSANNAAAQ